MKIDNQPIGEFMGLTLVTHKGLTHKYWETFTKDGYEVLCSEANAAYHSSWGWLMPVIEKINSLGKEYRFDIMKGYATCTVEKAGKFHKDFKFASSVTFEKKTPLEGCYELVLKFIKYYNETVPSKDITV